MTDDHSLLLDQFVVMIRTELIYTVSNNPCSSPLHVTQSPIDSNEWRRKICQWCFRVVDHLQMDREVVSVALNLFDRFLISQGSSDRYDVSIDDDVCSKADLSLSCGCFHCQRTLDSRSYQLAAMTSLYLAIKLQAVSETQSTWNPTPLILPNLNSKTRKSSTKKNDCNKRRTLHFQAFVQLSRGQFTANDVCEMEQIILHELRWLVHPPTPMMFCSYMLAAFMPSTLEHARLYSRNTRNYYVKQYEMVQHVIQELSRYITELAICLEKECYGKRPSQIAFCAIMSSMNLLTMSALPMSIRESFYERAMAVLPYKSANFHKENTRLRASLQNALWPELLLDEPGGPFASNHSPSSNSCQETISKLFHPISIAREYGLLDMDRIYRGHTSSISTANQKYQMMSSGSGKENSTSKLFRSSTPFPPDSPAGTSTTCSSDGSLIVTPTL